MDSLTRMNGGEIFIPKIPSMSILDLAEAIAPDCEINIVGIRPGEKLHEAMITEDDARHTLEYDDILSFNPNFHGGVRNVKTAASRYQKDLRMSVM